MTRADLLRGILLVKTGESEASFDANAAAAVEAGLGKWDGPTSDRVTVGEAGQAALRAINGTQEGPAEATHLLASRGLIAAGRSAGEAIRGAELLALLDGVRDLTESGEQLTPVPAPAARAKEGFEDFGAPVATPWAARSARPSRSRSRSSQPNPRRYRRFVPSLCRRYRKKRRPSWLLLRHYPPLLHLRLLRLRLLRRSSR